MGKSIPCTVVCNTKYGYCMTPKECKSIREALRYAKNMGMAYRIIDKEGNVIRAGWMV